MLFALLTSIVLGVVTKRTDRERMRYAAYCFAWFVAADLRTELADVPGARITGDLLDLEKTLLRKVGEAITRFKMIRDGDRVAVALSGGKDSLTLLEALLLLARARSDRVHGVRVHGGAGQISAAHSSRWANI